MSASVAMDLGLAPCIEGLMVGDIRGPLDLLVVSVQVFQRPEANLPGQDILKDFIDYYGNGNIHRLELLRLTDGIHVIWGAIALEKGAPMRQLRKRSLVRLHTYQLRRPVSSGNGGAQRAYLAIDYLEHSGELQQRRSGGDHYRLSPQEYGRSFGRNPRTILGNRAAVDAMPEKYQSQERSIKAPFELSQASSPWPRGPKSSPYLPRPRLYEGYKAIQGKPGVFSPKLSGHFPSQTPPPQFPYTLPPPQQAERPLNYWKLGDLFNSKDPSTKKHYLCDVFGVVISVSHVVTRRIGTKRDFRIIDPTTPDRGPRRQGVLMSTFVDPHSFNPPIGTVGLFRCVKTHDYEDVSLNSYQEENSGREWFITDQEKLNAFGIPDFDIARMRKWWLERNSGK